ncbi:hypothetical protein JTB14_014936 [Gonioctena quinquepunctata]|nr:hypothetical protein JTB14_014936 [Gonioctena quinquepunctata]
MGHKTSGAMWVILDFIIYQGSTTELATDHADVFVISGAFITLAQRITKPHFRYYDNFFGNYNVLQYLSTKSVYASRTPRIGRFRKPLFFSGKVMKEQGLGTCEEVFSTDGIVMVDWYDNESVVIASSYKGLGTIDICKRDKSQKVYVQIPIPEVIKDL